MEQTDLLRHLIEGLEADGLECFITGFVAAMRYSQPRLTRDIDVAVALSYREPRT